MRALTVIPERKNSLALSQVAEPEPTSDELLVQTLMVGICGTDREIIAGKYGAAPSGEERLVVGHEVLGAVVRAPKASNFRSGDLVVGLVRGPDPVPCASCGAGEWDMCQNGLFTERGILGRHGYASDFFSLEERFALAVPGALRHTGVLIEPTSIVAKAWEQIDSMCTRLHAYAPKCTLIAGAGPVGLLAALLAVQRGHDVHVFDRHVGGLKPQLVRELGAKYYTQLSALPVQPEIVVECTGAGEVVFGALRKTARNAIVCLAGLSSGQRVIELAANTLNDRLVLENEVLFGSVNANRWHYDAALAALERAPRAWLEQLISRRVPVERFSEAFVRLPEDVKVVLDWAA